ncbi:hypothetical protein M8C21_007106 [Ambrosia artemisiifolia]|uniref:RRM domain-containing protein n=1 Tax=Ambrosia artemisiifolia TaxID=4212 RepID=A0AAD5CLZ9_AMBAR|nr:hypothetical protein M8C21_007106 [Ambrosia artemisiifolia]
MARVYVGNLDPKVNERDIEDEFRTFGVIRSVWVARRPPGYAFDDKHDAQDAIRELDGVWPHSPSFDDKGYGPTPPNWKGKCVVAANFTGCNNTNPDEKLSPADLEGHGTHTVSTAASIPVKTANIFGIGNGTTRGGVDSARIAAYKVYWGGSCSEMDLLAGLGRLAPRRVLGEHF